MDTLLLNPVTWDLINDGAGNIAMASEPYSLAQDAASACRAYLGELYYDTTQGVPYDQSILGKPLVLSFLRQQLEEAAETVPGVVSAVVLISSFVDRQVTGQVQVTDVNNNTTVASF